MSDRVKTTLWTMILLPLAFAGCYQDPIVGVPSGVSVTAAPDSVKVGEMVRVTVTNASRYFVLRDPCVLVLERRTGDSWETEVSTSCVGGGSSLVTLAPGAVHHDSIATAVTMPAGDYRARFDLRGQNGRRLPESELASNIVTFTQPNSIQLQ